MSDPLPSPAPEPNEVPADPQVSAEPEADEELPCLACEIIVDARRRLDADSRPTGPHSGALAAGPAHAYLIATARPGGTMMRQGPDVAIGRLHPEFVVRLAGAIREARASGLPEAGIFSAYRPPAFGVGGFVDKFNSLHAYGLAVDMYGIGAPGSAEALHWHEIAAKHGIVCPYGPYDPAEWNHCQPTQVRIVMSENPLRETITANGPITLEGMFEAGSSVIAGMKDAAFPTAPSAATLLHSAPPPRTSLLRAKPLRATPLHATPSHSITVSTTASTMPRPLATGASGGRELRQIVIVIDQSSRTRSRAAAKTGAKAKP